MVWWHNQNLCSWSRNPPVSSRASSNAPVLSKNHLKQVEIRKDVHLQFIICSWQLIEMLAGLKTYFQMIYSFHWGLERVQSFLFWAKVKWFIIFGLCGICMMWFPSCFGFCSNCWLKNKNHGGERVKHANVKASIKTTGKSKGALFLWRTPIQRKLPAFFPLFAC